MVADEVIGSTGVALHDDKLEKVGPAPSRQAMLRAIKDIGRFDIGGLIMTFGPNKNEGLDQVFLTAIQSDGSFKAVRKLYR